QGAEERRDARESASPARACRRRRVLHWQQPTQLLPEMLHWRLDWSGPRAPVPLLSATFCPRDIVCAVAYSQFCPEPPRASSAHCWRDGGPPVIAQNEVTVFDPVSCRPTRSHAAAAACSSVYVHAWVPAKLVLQAALAPGRPSIRL